METVIDKATGEIDPAFALESAEPGVVPDWVISELRTAYRGAKEYSSALSEVIKQQAEKYALQPAALRRYVAALENDSLADAAKEASDLERLIG